MWLCVCGKKELPKQIYSHKCYNIFIIQILSNPFFIGGRPMTMPFQYLIPKAVTNVEYESSSLCHISSPAMSPQQGEFHILMLLLPEGTSPKNAYNTLIDINSACIFQSHFKIKYFDQQRSRGHMSLWLVFVSHLVGQQYYPYDYL